MTTDVANMVEIPYPLYHVMTTDLANMVVIPYLSIM